VAVVTHGGFYHVVIMALTGASGPDGLWFSMHNTGITRVDFRPTHISIVYHNRLDHLSPELVS
jgi:broad specificity phosphatase PhoE